MPPTLFLLVFLPILLYGSGSALDWHTFFRNLNPILTLAFPGVAIHTALVAVIYKYVFPYAWSWKEAFLFGSIISATDPVAVVGPSLLLPLRSLRAESRFLSFNLAQLLDHADHCALLSDCVRLSRCA